MDVPSGYFHFSCTFLNRRLPQLRSLTTKMPRASSLQSRRRERRPHPYRRPPQSVTRESNDDQEVFIYSPFQPSFHVLTIHLERKAGRAVDPQDQVVVGQASAEELEENEKTTSS